MPPVFLPTAPDTRTPLGVEYGAKYALIANGERVVFNDRLDRDFIGFLTGDDAITGLDRANVRSNIDELSEADGAVAGPQFYGARPWTLAGMIDPGVPKTTQNVYIDKLMRATDAMLSDAQLLWTPTGGIPVMLTARQTQATKITTRWPKHFLVAMTSPDPRIYSQALHTAQLVSPATSIDIANVGGSESWPVITFFGPCTSPTLTNGANGSNLVLNNNGGLSLVAGEWAAVDTNPMARTITKNDGTNLYDKLNFSASTWVCLQGNATNTLTVAYATGGNAMGVQWRDAWK